MTPDLARRAGSFAICAFAATVPLTIAGANMSWGLLAASLTALFAVKGEVRWASRKSALENPLLFFLAVSILTTALGTDPAHSIRYTHQDVHKVWIYYLLMVAIASCPTRAWKAWLTAGFAVAAVIGIAQAVPTFFLHIPAEQKVRAHAFVHPVTYGGQMAVALIGAVAVLCAPDERRPELKRLAALGAVLFAIALFFSNTRAAILSAIAGLCAVFVIIPRLRKWVFLMIPTSILAIAVLEIVMPERALIAPLVRAVRTGNTDNQQLLRFQLWDGAIQMAKDHPLTGVGHNNFREEFPKYVDTVFDDGRKSFGTAHNLFFQHLAERGILGLAASFWLFGALLLEAWRRSRHKQTAMNLWALGVSVAFLTQNMTEVALQVEILWLLVFFVWIAAEIEYKESLKPHRLGDEQ